MPTPLEKGYVFAMLDELEPVPILAPGATDDGRQRFDVRRRFDITSFGIQAFHAPNGVDIIREHDEIVLGEAGQEELYVVLNGAATFEIDGESVEAPAGSFVHVQPTAKRKATAKAEGTTIPVAGGTPGKAYEPAPEEAGDALVNAGCFATRAGRADEAIEHLRRAVELNGRIRELMATDEDLDSVEIGASPSC
jgi:hypothetical protein